MDTNKDYYKISSYEARKGQVKKIVLLYSGSLYTTALIPWLKETYKAEVVTVTVDIGQKVNFAEIKDDALRVGASKAIFIDAKQEFAEKYIAKAIRANTAYREGYHLSAPLSRPLLAKHVVKIAEEEGASAIAHGASGQSNDQVRYESLIITLNQDMKIIAPLRGNEFSLKDSKEYAKKYKIAQEYQDPYYATDKTLWGASILGGTVENTFKLIHVEHLLSMTTLPEKAPDTPESVTVEFFHGLPIKVNGKQMPLTPLIQELNIIAGRNGVGISYHITDIIIGVKLRSIDEEPAATLLINAHKELEKYVCTREENDMKPLIDTKWMSLCHDGLWYEPLIADIDAFITTVNKKVNGTVSIQLYKGNMDITNVRAPQTIFERKRAMHLADYSIINPHAFPGYIEIHSLPMRLAYRKESNILLTIGKRNNKLKLIQSLREIDRDRVTLYATYKTHKFLARNGISSILVNKMMHKHLEPNLRTLLLENRFDVIIRIPSAKKLTQGEKEAAQFIQDKAKENNVLLIASVEEAHKLLESYHKALKKINV
ncbi:MAG TPA: argininosuccinate synthase [Patescibacteria group bacterium]|nr:argininosuccinate synthase [Patescibacteria group bacterium]